MRDEKINSLRPLYQIYRNYKELVKFYNEHKDIYQNVGPP